MSIAKIIDNLNLMTARLDHLEESLVRLEEKTDYAVSVMRSQLIRIKNGDSLSDDTVWAGQPYADLSPEKASHIYQNDDLDFLILDVCQEGYERPIELEGVIQIPLEELRLRLDEIKSQTIPIMVISEEGTRSIRAAECLIQHGFYNISNVSGGYKYWPKNLNSHTTVRVNEGIEEDDLGL